MKEGVRKGGWTKERGIEEENGNPENKNGKSGKKNCMKWKRERAREARGRMTEGARKEERTKKV